MENIPNDIHREIMKLLDSRSICYLYLAHKMFWVLTKDQIKYHRIVLHVLPHGRGCDDKTVLDEDQLIWLSTKLTAESKLKLTKRDPKFFSPVSNDRWEYTNIGTGIYPKSRRGCVGDAVYLKIWVKYDMHHKLNIKYKRPIPKSSLDRYDIIIPMIDLVDIIMEQ